MKTGYTHIVLLIDRSGSMKSIINPRNSTALLDSMYRFIQEAGWELNTLADELKPSKVLFVTITDGEENASCEVTYDELRMLIRLQEDVYSWDFVYIGANQDSFAMGRNLVIKSNISPNFEVNRLGVINLYSDLSNAISRYRKSKERFGFTDQEQGNDIKE